MYPPLLMSTLGCSLRLARTGSSWTCKTRLLGSRALTTSSCHLLSSGDRAALILVKNVSFSGLQLVHHVNGLSGAVSTLTSP